MTKEERRAFLKELKKVDESESESESKSDSESESESESVRESQVLLNEKDDNISKTKEETKKHNDDEDDDDHEEHSADRYVPVFLQKRIDLNDKKEYDFSTMLSIVNQIRIDKCGKNEAQRRVCEYLNQFYAVITNQTHETIMVTKIYKPEFGYCDLSEITINSFKTNMSNLEVVYVLPNKHVKVRKLGDFYIESPYRLNYNRMVFNPYPAGHPNAASSKDLNMFTGLPFTLEECRRAYEDPQVYQMMQWIREHYIYNTVCNEDKFAFEVFEHWFGAKIREPWLKLNWMILFFGGFGSGKSTLMKKIIKVIFGVYCKIISDIKAVFGEFDSIKKNALIILLDENVAPETKAQEAKLTSEITSSFITVNEKFKKTEQVISFHEYIGGVNPKNKVFLKLGDRRVFVIRTNEKMTLTHNWESDKVEYWNKVNAYLDDVRVVKAYQYHLQCMLVANPNIKIGLHAPYSKIKDELMLLQSPDSLAFAKAIIERGFIVPQSRLSDCKAELNKYFTNLQGREFNLETGKYDSPWVRELTTKDVEKEFRLLFPHSSMKNNTLWRELCYIFDIKTSEEDRMREAGKSGQSMLMTRFHKNPNVKTKITNVNAFTTKPSLIKNMVGKNGKLKNKIYYLWPTFYDAYTQFTSKTKLIIDLSPAAKEMFENELMRRKLVGKKRKEPDNESADATKIDGRQNKKRTVTSTEREKQRQEEEEEEEEIKLVSPPKKRRLNSYKAVADKPEATTDNKVQLHDVVFDRIKELMEELKSTREKQQTMEKMVLEMQQRDQQQQQQQHQQQQQQRQEEEQRLMQCEPRVITPSIQYQHDSSLQTAPLSQPQVQTQAHIQVQPQIQLQAQPQAQPQPQIQAQPQIQVQAHTQTQVQAKSKTHPDTKSQKLTEQYMPYPVQKVINVYNPLGPDQMHFDTQHQSQEMVLDGNSNQGNFNEDNLATFTAYQLNESSSDVPVLMLATPMFDEAEPEKVNEQLEKNYEHVLPKRITTTKILKALNNN